MDAMRKLWRWINAHSGALALFITPVTAMVAYVVSPLEREDVISGVRETVRFVGADTVLPRWQFLTLGVAAVIAVLLVGAHIAARFREDGASDDSESQPHMRFTEGVFARVFWRWRWESMTTPRGVYDLTPYCQAQRCNKKLELKEDYLVCPKHPRERSAKFPSRDFFEQEIIEQIEDEARRRYLDHRRDNEIRRGIRPKA